VGIKKLNGFIGLTFLLVADRMIGCQRRRMGRLTVENRNHGNGKTENEKMNREKRPLSVAALASLLAIFISPLLTMSTIARDRPVVRPPPARGAPGPIVGAGLPILAIGMGYGVYWLVKRRRKDT
jgi:hypothetical protein